jgi:hypothetical protein
LVSGFFLADLMPMPITAMIIGGIDNKLSTVGSLNLVTAAPETNP